MSNTMIIGLDGMPPTLLQEYSRLGAIPTISELLDAQGISRMQSSIPTISNVSWTSMFTGTNPGVHGIFGFTDYLPDRRTRCFPNRNAIKAAPYWQGGGHVVINMPGTYPPCADDGTLIAGFVALDISRAIHPPELLSLLKLYNYQIDVDVAKAVLPPLFYRQLQHTLWSRKKVALELIQQPWKTFTFIVTGTDRLLHYYWHDRYASQVLEYMQQVDDTVKSLLQHTTDDTQIILLSDHGMTECIQRINLGELFRDTGLDVQVLDPGRIYTTDTEAVIEICKHLQYKGKQVILQIYTRDELYQGSQIDKAPDIVVQPVDGYSLYSSKNTEVCSPPDKIVGIHTPDAFVSTRFGYPPQHIEEVRQCIMS